MNILKSGLSLGVIATIVLYTSGFIWQYAYLASVTDHLGWIKIVTTDYIHLGVLALMFTFDSKVFAIVAVSLVIYFSGIFGYSFRLFWLNRTDIQRRKMWSFINGLGFSDFKFSRSFFKLVIYLIVLVFAFRLPLEIIERARESLYYRLANGPLDILCENEGDCHKGKVLYISDKQYYFYTYNGGVNYKNGSLLLIDLNNANLNLDWHPREKSKVDRFLEANALDL